ncbi:TPA: sprT domain-containing protein [Candidatus Woesearchaeota archaeon]|jgi:predicted SprT family Zn-dependent metalloprotease|nr:sprT domain-containing protein [Candidatus Woesearchaeota archaeon]|tara:strand:+ start:352 stop:861 length:510 start_codon:yes stop_codon:yes gene_type:complete
MELHTAKLLARQLMDQHGLSHILFKFDRSKRRLGSCRWKTSTGACVHISLSKEITLLNSEEVVRNTLLHEIAHALTGHGNGHNWLWRRKAREIGCNAKRCSSTHVRTEGRWRGVCPKCKTIFQRHRGGKGVNSIRICGKCGGEFRFVDTRKEVDINLFSQTLPQFQRRA